jgi:hypothetical protein
MPIRTAILTVNMGTGLAIDALILSAILKQLDHVVEVRDQLHRPADWTPPDCAIFLERFNPRWVGRVNVLIPNHEFVRPDETPLLSRFEIIACKTQDAMHSFENIAKDRLIHIGWTSLDRRLPDATMDFDQCLHIAGHSAHKGTAAVIEAWRANPDFPKLTLLDWRKVKPTPPDQANIEFISERISEIELMRLMNRCGVHLCPSTCEGFGHTMHEAMSCGAALITTDGPPMNELTRDCAVLVKPSRRGTFGLATTHEVDASQIAAGVRRVMKMSVEQRRSLGLAGRRRWDENWENFARSVENLARIMVERVRCAPAMIPAPS